MAVSLPAPKPQRGSKPLPVGAVVSGEHQPHAPANFLPSVLRDDSEDSPEKTAILVAQAGKAHLDNQHGLGKASKSGGYGFRRRKDTENPNHGKTKPDNKAGNNHEPLSSSVSCDKQQDKVDAVQGAAPTRPASARKRSNNGLRELRVSVGGKLSKLFGFGGGGGRESPPPGSPREAATILLPWEPHESLSKTLDYRPRGHGRAFLDSYEVGAVLGSGGFAVVLEGEEVFRPTTKTEAFMKASTTMYTWYAQVLFILVRAGSTCTIHRLGYWVEGRYRHCIVIHVSGIRYCLLLVVRTSLMSPWVTYDTSIAGGHS